MTEPPDTAKPREPDKTKQTVSSVDVAARAGVSQATVSRVLSGKDRVSPATRDKVLEALDELGYQPNLVARALKTQRTGTIAVVIADITNPFYPEIVEALSDELAASEQQMLLWNEASHENDGLVLDSVQQGLVDGVIFTTVTSESVMLERAQQLETPIVLVNRTVPNAMCDTVTCDNVLGGRVVAQYFAEHNRRPAVIAGPANASTSSDRVTGFCELYPAGEEMAPEFVRFADFSHDAGVAFCDDMMSRPDAPDAIFAANDLLAFGVLDAARRLGISVPEDLWVVGYDDIDMASWSNFDLTTVRQPSRRMAADAVAVLRNRLDDPNHPPQHLRYRSELIVRSSTANAPATSPDHQA